MPAGEHHMIIHGATETEVSANVQFSINGANWEDLTLANLKKFERARIPYYDHEAFGPCGVS
jgi:hypothetical protein